MQQQLMSKHQCLAAVFTIVVIVKVKAVFSNKTWEV